MLEDAAAPVPPTLPSPCEGGNPTSLSSSRPTALVGSGGFAVAAPDPPIELSVIAPCFNEELNVGELARRVVATFARGQIRGELVLVDDGSRDGTKAAIQRLERTYPGVVVGRFHPKNRGIAQGWKTGVAAARGRLVSVIDSDLQYQPEDLLRLRRELFEHSVDVVQGWRSPTGRERGARYNLSRGFNVLLNTTFGMHLRDNKSGFVLCAKEVMEDLLTYRGSYYYWQSFIMVAAHAKGYSYKEVETLFEQRKAGQSFLDDIAYRASARSLVDLAAATWEYRLGRRAADVAEQFLRRHPTVDRSARAPLKSRARYRAYLAAFERTHHMLTRDVERYHALLTRTQWLAPRHLRALQDEKLRRLVRHAYRNVPFYRERMRALDVRPEDVHTQADLGKLPILEKDDVRRHVYFDILSENHDKDDVLRLTVCGADGEPFVTFSDRVQLEQRWAAALRAREWTGYQFGDAWAELEAPPYGASPRELERRKLEAALARRSCVPVLGLRAGALDRALRALTEPAPTLVRGWAEALDVIAQAGPPSAPPRAVQTTGQTLTDAIRRRIRDGFGGEVFDAYELGEVGGVAFECDAHTGLHVVGENLIVEIWSGDRPAAPGEIGDVLVTDLTNTCLPFVRYRTGDRARAVPEEPACPCGRGLPRIDGLVGRPPRVLHGEDGRLVPATLFARLFQQHEHAVRSFRVEEAAPGVVSIHVVPAGRYSDETERSLRAAAREALGAARIEWVLHPSPEGPDHAARVDASPPHPRDRSFS